MRTIKNHTCALFLFNQLEESLKVFIVMFLSLGTDYQTFGTVAESKENWTQRAKTEWETPWQSKIFLKKAHSIFWIFKDHLKRKKLLVKMSLFL